MASKTLGGLGICGRYASAIFDLAIEGGEIDAVTSDLRQLKAMIRKSQDLRRLIESQVLSREDQAAGMTAVIKKAGFTDLTRRFVAIVAHNRRLFILTRIIDAFFALLAEKKGEETATVISAKALSEAQLKSLERGLKKAVGKKVSLETRVDASLIGGLIVQVGSRLVDSSLRHKLDKLQLAMKGVG